MSVRDEIGTAGWSREQGLVQSGRRHAPATLILTVLRATCAVIVLYLVVVEVDVVSVINVAVATVVAV